MPVQPFASVAFTVIGKLPVWVEFPERMPVELSSVIPAGSVPVSLQVIVPLPPEAVKVSLKAALAVPVVVAGLSR